MQTNLAELRTQRKLSQIGLADLLGVTKLTVGRWERGEMMPRQYFRERLCKIFEGQDLFFTRVEDVAARNAHVPSSPIYDPAIPFSPAIPLVGREQDFARIKAQLQSEGMIIALHGLPGVGKTSLAIQLVHDPEIRASFCDGILWAGLGPTPDICSLLNRWGARLQLGEAFLSLMDIQEKYQALREALGTRSMLLVLDDTWRLEDVHALLHVGGPNCRVLLTTRFLTIAVDGDACPLAISELDEEQSLHLLRNLVPEVVSHYETDVRELVHVVGGLPLALTLLGKYLLKESYQSPARRVEAAIERLSEVSERFKISQIQGLAHPGLPDGAAISLLSVIEVSDRLLTSLARDALYALSVFPPKPESFSEEAALAVGACSIRELDELLDAGLIAVQGKDCYQIHPVITDYARLHLDEQARLRVQQRLLAYETNMQEAIEPVVAVEASDSIEEAVQTGYIRQSARCIRAHFINRPTREKSFALSIRSRRDIKAALIAQLGKAVPERLEWQMKRLLSLLGVGLDQPVVGLHGELYSALAAFMSAWGSAQKIDGLPKLSPDRCHSSSEARKGNNSRRPSSTFWAETLFAQKLHKHFLGKVSVWEANIPRLVTAGQSSMDRLDRPP